MARVSVIGASGYTGGELVKLLLRHPRIKIGWLTSENNAGRKISDIHGSLRGRCDIVCKKLNLDKLVSDSDVIFSCLPHGSIFDKVQKILKARKKLIDLSADFRLKDTKLYEMWYKFKHIKPDLLQQACYGMPEINRDDIRKAHLIANPGCYSTASILALLPIVKEKAIVFTSIVVDAKSGVSGAGRKPNLAYHFPEANENILAYKVAEHRHIPEIEQELSMQAKHPVSITFVPHLIPVDRGILVTCYTKLSKRLSAKNAHDIYSEYYEKEPFVQVLPMGEFPQVKAVVYSNNCWLGLKFVEKTKELIVVGVIDNLLKGASGQAVQNMNIACGFPETVSLL